MKARNYEKVEKVVNVRMYACEGHCVCLSLGLLRALWMTTTTSTTFNGLFSRTTWVSWYQKGKPSLHLNEARDYGFLGSSGISWIICKQFASHCRQVTTTTPHHSIFTGRMLFLTVSKHWKQEVYELMYEYSWNFGRGKLDLWTVEQKVSYVS